LLVLSSFYLLTFKNKMNMINLSQVRAFITAGFLALAVPASAQILNPSSSPEFIYPSSPVLKAPETISNYSFRNVNTGFGSADLYLSGWSGATNGFTWILTVPGAPTAVFAQGTFPYSNVRDVEVGFVRDGGTEVIYVAYYLNGVGHFMDTYKITGSTATPVAYSSTMALSSSSQYGRIRVESHKSYGTAVVWYNPGVGVQTIAGSSNTFGNIVTLAGTIDDEDPDLAFSHASGPLNLHYAYHNKTTYEITESVLDWSFLLTVPPGFVSPVIEDINYVGTNAPLRLVIDCPDHYDVENWAYTYCANGWQISVRYIDYHTTATPTTAVVNDSSLGNVPLYTKNFSPCLAYNDGSYGEQIQIGWYATNGPLSGYVGLHFNESFTTLLSAPDYNILPNAGSSTFYPYPLRPGVAYSKASDIGGIAPDFLYACFYDFDGPSGTFNLHHAFHPWGIPTFKGYVPPVYHPECGSHSHDNVLSKVADQVSVYPNPFTDKVSTVFTTKEAGNVKLQLFDVTGRLVDQTSTETEAGQHTLTTSSLKEIPAGIYQLQVSMNGERLAQQKIMKK
jgi:hypothetical protein